MTYRSVGEVTSAYTAYSAYSAAQAVACPVGTHWDAVVQTCLPDKITWNNCSSGQVYVEGKGCTAPESTPTSTWKPCGPGMVYEEGRGCVYTAEASAPSSDTPKTVAPSADTPKAVTQSSDTPKAVYETKAADVPTQAKLPAVVKAGETGSSSSSTTWIVGGLALAAAVGIYFATRKR